MKKLIWFLMLCLLLSSCSLSKESTIELEKNASLTIEVSNLAYGKALISLWKTKYPQQKDAIKIVEAQDSFHQQFYYDIEWVNDGDALSKRPYALAFDITSEYEVPSSLKRATLKEYFQPIQAEGMLYVYAQPMLETFSLQKEDLSDFAMFHQPHMYYYHHGAKQLLPLWLSRYEPNQPTSLEDIFLDDEFLTCIQDMKALYEKLQLEDDPYHTSTFFREGYMSGLLPSKEIPKQPYYASQQLHIQSMPSYQDEDNAPFVDTYGFMINKDCPYPNCAKAFMNMVRSKEGLQAYLDYGDGVAILKEEDIQHVHIFDSLKKEMIAAMNHSRLWNMGVIKEKPSIHYKDLYLKTDIVSIMQNGIVAKKSAKTIQKEIHAYSKAWCLHQ